MKRQLDLWPEPEKPTHGLNIWESIDYQAQRTVIEALARLISKVVYPETLNDTKEKKDER